MYAYISWAIRVLYISQLNFVIRREAKSEKAAFLCRRGFRFVPLLQEPVLSYRALWSVECSILVRSGAIDSQDSCSVPLKGSYVSTAKQVTGFTELLSISISVRFIGTHSHKYYIQHRHLGYKSGQELSTFFKDLGVEFKT